MSLPFDPTADLYATLGVKAEASAGEIKKAYRRLAKKYHPDSTGGDKAKEAKFKEISTAYDVLGDPEKRAQYDAFRTGPQYQYPPGFEGAGGFPGGAGFSDGASFSGSTPDLGDLFSRVFGGGRARAESGNGRGVRYSFSYGGNPFQQVDNGDPFAGNGFRPGRRVQRRRRRPSSNKPHEHKVRLGDGTLATQRGSSIYADVRISLDQAILGTVVEVPTLSGKAKVKIPPGTSSGAKLRLRGKGATDDSGRAGDHYVVVQIDVPKKIDEKAKKLLVQFMRRVGQKRS